MILTLTSLPEPSRLTSSASSAVPSISAVKWSMWAMGLVPIVWSRGKTLFHFTVIQWVYLQRTNKKCLEHYFYMQKLGIDNHRVISTVLCSLKHWNILMRLTLQMNSISSLSISFTTMIFILLRKCSARSLRASLSQDSLSLAWNMFTVHISSLMSVCSHR